MEYGSRKALGNLSLTHGMFLYLFRLYAWYGLVYTVFPLAFHLSFCITSPSLLYSPTNTRFLNPIHKRFESRTLLVFVLVYHFLDTCSMTIFYGLVSTIISPGKTWLLVWSVHVLRKYSCFSGPSKSSEQLE
jgi:hypothetical protein